MFEGIGSTADKEAIEELRRELQEFKDHFDIERREIEQACRLEITDVEERHDQEKAHLLNHIEQEKVRMWVVREDIQFVFSDAGENFISTFL